MTVTRRTVVRSAAWSLPVIAAAVAVPLAAASTAQPPAAAVPVKCVQLSGPPHKTWQGVYSDGTTTEPMDNGTAMSDKTWGPLCRAS
jgi:hypothetical protein